MKGITDGDLSGDSATEGNDWGAFRINVLSMLGGILGLVSLVMAWLTMTIATNRGSFGRSFSGLQLFDLGSVLDPALSAVPGLEASFILILLGVLIVVIGSMLSFLAPSVGGAVLLLGALLGLFGVLFFRTTLAGSVQGVGAGPGIGVVFALIAGVFVIIGGLIPALNLFPRPQPPRSVTRGSHREDPKVPTQYFLVGSAANPASSARAEVSPTALSGVSSLAGVPTSLRVPSALSEVNQSHSAPRSPVGGLPAPPSVAVGRPQAPSAVQLRTYVEKLERAIVDQRNALRALERTSGPDESKIQRLRNERGMAPLEWSSLR